MKFSCLILISGLLMSCSTGTQNRVLYSVKDSKGRVVKEIREGFQYGEGSFRRTIFYDSLGREIKVLEVLENTKTVKEYQYSDSSTYEYYYYDLGHTDSYTDSNFLYTEKDIVFHKHIRLNKKGILVYQFTKWLDDSIHCQEWILDSLGNEISLRDVDCK